MDYFARAFFLFFSLVRLAALCFGRRAAPALPLPSGPDARGAHTHFRLLGSVPPAARASQALSCSGRSFFPHPLFCRCHTCFLGSSPPKQLRLSVTNSPPPRSAELFSSLSAGPFLSRVSRCRPYCAFLYSSLSSSRELVGGSPRSVYPSVGRCVLVSVVSVNGSNVAISRPLLSYTTSADLLSLSTPFQDLDYQNRLDDSPVTHRRTTQEKKPFDSKPRPYWSRALQSTCNK